MSTCVDQAEEQAIAQGILHDLDAGLQVDPNPFLNKYHGELTKYAKGWLTKHSMLKSKIDGEDLVQGFYSAKVFQPRKAHVMFGPAASGKPCPSGKSPPGLLSRLRWSLRNYCISQARSPALADGPRQKSAKALDATGTEEEIRKAMRPPPSPKKVHRPKSNPLPDYEDLAKCIDEQIHHIREFLDLRNRATCRVALLLRHRLDWAAAFVGRPLPMADGGSVELTLDLLLRLTSWDDAELKSRLGTSALSLERAWADLLPLLLAAPNQKISMEEVADVLGVACNTWYQWVSRGRRRLEERLGDVEYKRVFFLWPPKPKATGT